MRRFVRQLAFFCLAACVVLSGPASGATTIDDEEGHNIESIADLNGKRLGILAGTMLDDAANDALDFTHITYFDDMQSEIQALIAGEIDAIIDDEPVARYVAANNPQLLKLDDNLQYDDYGFAVHPDNVKLFFVINPVVEDLVRDGTVERLVTKWVEGSDADRVMPPPAKTDAALPVLRFGVSSVSAPFAYPGPDGGVIGLDIELMGIVARRVGYRLEVVDMEFAELVPSVLDGEVAIIGSCLSITEDRKRIIRFTTGYYTGGVAALVRNPALIPRAGER